MLANGPIFGDEIKSMSIIVEYMQANCKTRRFRSFVGGQVTTQGLGMIYRLKVTYGRDPKNENRILLFSHSTKSSLAFNGIKLDLLRERKIAWDNWSCLMTSGSVQI